MQANLSKFKELIDAAYKRHSSLNYLIASMFIREVPDPPTVLPQSVGKPGGGFVLEGGQLPASNVLTIRTVTPTNIGGTASVAGLSDINHHYPIESVCERIGSFLADRELVVLRDGLMKYSGKRFHTVSTGMLKASDVQEPMNWIYSNQYSADRLLIPLNQESNLFSEEQLLLYASNVHDHSKRFVARIGPLEVYWMNDLSNTALMFENFEMSFLHTPLKLKFDDEQKPTRLIFEVWCASAPTNEISAAIIEY
jgi:hypothetical protein